MGEEHEAVENSEHLRSQRVGVGTLFCTGERQPLGFLTWRPEPGAKAAPADLAAAYHHLASHLRRHSMVVLLEKIFARREAASSVLAARDSGIAGDAGRFDPAPALIEGVPCHGGQVAGVHLVAARPAEGTEPRTVSRCGHTAGVEVLTPSTRFLGLPDVSRHLADTPGLSPAEEAERTILLAAEILAENGYSFHDVPRTWFYLDDILSWYDDFNRARNGVFDRLGLHRDGTMVIPASTGIAGVGNRGGGCMLDLVASRPVGGAGHEVTRLLNPKQNEAPEYGSAFSRGLRLKTGDTDVVFVSGTASINDDGLSTHPGDFTAQTTTSIDTVAALLATAGARIQDVAQATAFVKRSGDTPELERILEARGMRDQPIVCTIADVCREELLFEIDATVVL